MKALGIWAAPVLVAFASLAGRGGEPDVRRRRHSERHGAVAALAFLAAL